MRDARCGMRASHPPASRSLSGRRRDPSAIETAHRARSLPGCPPALLDRARSALGRPWWTCTPGRENGRDIAFVLPPSGSARADPPSVGGLPVEPDLQIVMDVVIGLHVLVNRGRRVDVIDHEIELAVIIEIRIGRAIRKA